MSILSHSVYLVLITYYILKDREIIVRNSSAIRLRYLLHVRTLMVSILYVYLYGYVCVISLYDFMYVK